MPHTWWRIFNAMVGSYKWSVVSWNISFWWSLEGLFLTDVRSVVMKSSLHLWLT